MIVREGMHRGEQGPRMRGEPDHLRLAFDEHHDALVRLGFLLTGSTRRAEDLAQEAFVRAATAIPKLAPGQARTYLRRTMVNLWKNDIRRLRAERRALTLLQGQRTESPNVSIEDREALWAAVIRLPARQKVSVVLRYYEGLADDEIASILRSSSASVRSNISRGLARLRKEWNL